MQGLYNVPAPSTSTKNKRNTRPPQPAEPASAAHAQHQRQGDSTSSAERLHHDQPGQQHQRRRPLDQKIPRQPPAYGTACTWTEGRSRQREGRRKHRGERERRRGRNKERSKTSPCSTCKVILYRTLHPPAPPADHHKEPLPLKAPFIKRGKAPISILLFGGKQN